LTDEAIAMTYYEIRDPGMSVSKEIAGTWTFAASLVCVVLLILGNFD
jgi:hypothetical protein